MSDTITRARDKVRLYLDAGDTPGVLDPVFATLDEVLERGQAAEEGVRIVGDHDDFPTGYRQATLETAEHIAAAILKAASE